MNIDHTKQHNVLPLFDTIASRDAKIRGMGKAAQRNPHLPLAQEIAEELAKYRDITADDVMKALWTRHRILPSELGPASGSIFRPSKFHWTGEMRQSDRVSNHGRYNRVWRLK